MNTYILCGVKNPTNLTQSFTYKIKTVVGVDELLKYLRDKKHWTVAVCLDCTYEDYDIRVDKEFYLGLIDTIRIYKGRK